MALLGSRIICNNLSTEKKKEYSVVLPEMKTTMMAGVCLLALVLTFTIAECGPSQEKRQEPSQGPIICYKCIENCKATGKSHDECVAICVHCSGGGGQSDAPGDAPSGGPGDVPSGAPGDAPSGAPDGPDDDNVPDDNNGSGSGAAVAFSDLLVAVASAMN